MRDSEGNLPDVGNSNRYPVSTVKDCWRSATAHSVMKTSTSVSIALACRLKPQLSDCVRSPR